MVAIWVYFRLPWKLGRPKNLSMPILGTQRLNPGKDPVSGFSVLNISPPRLKIPRGNLRRRGYGNNVEKSDTSYRIVGQHKTLVGRSDIGSRYKNEC